MRWFILSETDLNWCTMYHRYCLLPQKPQTTDPNYNPFELRIYHLTRQIAKLKYSRAISLSKWILNASQSGILRINSPSAHNPFSTHKVWSIEKRRRGKSPSDMLRCWYKLQSNEGFRISGYSNFNGMQKLRYLPSIRQKPWENSR